MRKNNSIDYILNKFTPWHKREPGTGEKLCPYDGIAYKDVPGYVSGYGCPVCKAISFYHLPIPKEGSNSELLSYKELML